MSRAELVSFVDADPALSRLREEVSSRLDDDPGHDLAHALRVALWTIVLGEPLGVDPREAVAAALLHDVVNLPKNSPQRHLASEMSAAVASDELPTYGFDAEAVRRIAEAVRDHSFSRGVVPETALGQALQDADRLEALGALGLFRCVSTGTRMGARYFDDDDPFARDRPLDDRAYSVDHFYAKLLTLPDTMRTEAGRTEARRRAAFLEQTLAALASELGEPLP